MPVSAILKLQSEEYSEDVGLCARRFSEFGGTERNVDDGNVDSDCDIALPHGKPD